ncbi:type IIG restriction enzyme/methyltransferase [Paraburkholderia oxyphila]|uniref:type IIG restriction enzyme/methyltransferase n=1 Tax=Paraburkholderia oxyphila TaxID=614212 RepID=UPI000486DE95|nr:Eco57I restriction-modification methylase domain-containing protein [Paraburkholderia oxyphila]
MAETNQTSRAKRASRTGPRSASTRSARRAGLDADFYAGLLRIAGLDEGVASGKTVVARCARDERRPGALVELTIARMEASEAQTLNTASAHHHACALDREALTFRTALRLCIAWIGRVMFLKLLEARLLVLHDGDPAYAFLRSERIRSFADLDSLCREVLGNSVAEDGTPRRYPHLPRFDGSMFEPADLAEHAITLGSLDSALPPHARNTVTELLDFLDAFEFGFDANADTKARADKKRVDAATLGLVFEKLNGYRDGAWYTPGSIAMFLAREAIAGAVLGRFNRVKGWHCTTIDQLSKSIKDREEARAIFAALRVCDPAVGTGHLLASALDELLAIKSRLGLFDDREDHALAGLRLEALEDRLVIEHANDGTRAQQPRIDAALYREKRAIVECNLFGVDIDAQALGLARLRLAFELLAHAAYDDEGSFATLPDLEAHLKQGNAVLSCIAFDAEREDSTPADAAPRLAPAAGSDAFEWQREFPAIFVGDHACAGFDAVIANPPYIDSERMINEGQKPLREALTQRWPSARGNWDLYIVFMELGLALTAPHGTMAFLTPDKWLAKPFGAAFRTHHLDKIARVVALGRDVFERAMVDSIVTVYRKCGTDCVETACLEGTTLTPLARVRKRDLEAPWALDALLSPHYAFVQRLIRAHPALGSLLRCENACATSDAYRLAPLIDEAQEGFDARRHYRVVNTGTLGRYASRWNSKPMTYLGRRYAQPTVERSRFAATFANSYRTRADAKKVIVKGLTHLHATLDLAGDTIPGKTTLILCSGDENLLKFAAAVLNCPLAGFVTRARFGASSYNGGVAFTKAMIDALPVPADAGVRAEVVRMVDVLLRLNQSGDQAQCEALAREIDFVLYAAYGLGEKEIALIESLGGRR